MIIDTIHFEFLRDEFWFRAQYPSRIGGSRFWQGDHTDIFSEHGDDFLQDVIALQQLLVAQLNNAFILSEQNLQNQRHFYSRPHVLASHEECTEPNVFHFWTFDFGFKVTFKSIPFPCTVCRYTAEFENANYYVY
jgi:hypothetical protein